MIVVAITGILAAIALPQYTQYKERAYNTASKDNLHNIYVTCKAYWVDTSPNDNCSLASALLSTYGFVQNPNVALTITAGSGTESLFEVTASHSSASTIYTINSSGNITPLQ